jgi:hypothetical protein
MIMMGCGSSDSDDDDSGNGGGGGSTPVTIPVDFESGPYTFTNFDGGDGAVIDNPYKTGINTSSKVMQMVKDGGELWGGSKLILDALVDLSADKAFTVKMWSSRAVPVLLKFEGSDANAEIGAKHGGSSGWEQLTFDFSRIDTAALGEISSIVFMVDYGVLGDHSNNPNDWIFYFDDIKQIASSGAATVAVPVDFESYPYTIVGFDGGYPALVDNPDTSGDNSSDTVLRMIKHGGTTWGGGKLTVDSTVDLSTNKIFTMNVWASYAAPVLLKFEGSSGNSELTANHSGSSDWETLTFDFKCVNTAALGDVKDIVVIFDNGTLGDATSDATKWTFYLDDIEQTSGTCPEPLSAAPTPTDSSADVISVFSDAYTDISANYNPNWGQSTVVTTESISGNNVLKYQGLDYQGTEFGSAQDVSDKNALHIDYWTTDSTGFNVYAISTGPVEHPYAVDVTTDAWQSVDIPLSTFSDNSVDLTDVIQLKVDGNGTLYLDNIYFK